MNAFDQYEVWFVTGAQLLYGGDAVIAVGFEHGKIGKWNRKCLSVMKNIIEISNQHRMVFII